MAEKNIKKLSSDYSLMTKFKKRDGAKRRRLALALFLTLLILIFSVAKISGVSFKASINCLAVMMIVTPILTAFLIQRKQSYKLKYDALYVETLAEEAMKNDEPPFKILERQKKEHSKKSVIVWALVMVCFIWVLFKVGNASFVQVVKTVLFVGIPSFFLFKRLG